jgi:putative ABC transport system permease protein
LADVLGRDAAVRSVLVLGPVVDGRFGPARHVLAPVQTFTVTGNDMGLPDEQPSDWRAAFLPASGLGDRVGAPVELGPLEMPDGETVSVVGRYKVDRDLAHLELPILIPSDPVAVGSRRLVVVVRSSDAVTRVTSLARELVAPVDDRAVVSSREDELRQARSIVASASEGRHRLLRIVVVAAAVLSCFQTLTEVLLRRRDFGRRRVLGMSRLGLVGFVLAEGLFAVWVGLAVAIPSVLVVRRTLGYWNSISWILWVVLMELCIVVVACAPAAMASAMADPAKALRVP